MSKNRITEMYGLLEKMLECAEKKDGKGTIKINKSFSSIFDKQFDSKHITLQGTEYDHCRQSCIMWTTMPKMYDFWISDARKRLLSIKERGYAASVA